MAYSGKYFPKNPSKYRGDVHNIIYRSLWERKCMVYFDSHEDIIEWSSEEVVVPYKSPLDKRYHRYYPDFIIKIRTKTGEIQTVMIEVKPEKQTKPPERGKKVTRKYLKEIATWGVNEAKWDSAIEYCRDRGWKFLIMTEKTLNTI